MVAVWEGEGVREYTMGISVQEIRTRTEWQRWREASKWAWQGEKRRRWAEALWVRQRVGHCRRPGSWL